MNERIRQLAEQAGIYKLNLSDETEYWIIEKFAELIVQKCADICMEMSAKCAGLEGDGALAKDCAYWIQKDFGVEE
jgi:uncharacterized protein YutE (UPF0331/DUF86 family)